ncbi:hypothetical protein J4Q44_G00188280 [Coregonus suidteri]|uniref:Cadherin Y-type LIR-motif domain-containing protein n=1 Tax=Coregonus suidteri TaxID=861788 RepID=A0AAN8QTZ7_9TELE
MRPTSSGLVCDPEEPVGVFPGVVRKLGMLKVNRAVPTREITPQFVENTPNDTLDRNIHSRTETYNRPKRPRKTKSSAGIKYYKVSVPASWINVDESTGQLKIANTIDRESHFVVDGVLQRHHESCGCQNGACLAQQNSTSLGVWAILAMLLGLALLLLLCILCAFVCVTKNEKMELEDMGDSGGILLTSNIEAPRGCSGMAVIMKDSNLIIVPKSAIDHSVKGSMIDVGWAGAKNSVNTVDKMAVDNFGGGQYGGGQYASGNMTFDNTRFMKFNNSAAWNTWQTNGLFLQQKLAYLGTEEEGRYADDIIHAYGFEGVGSPAGSVGCCSDQGNQEDLDFLNRLGPKFNTLAKWSLVCDSAWKVHIAKFSLLVGSIFGYLVFGVLADWFGRHPVLIISVLFMLVFGLTVAFSVNVPMFSTLRFFEGFCLAGIALSLYILRIELCLPPWRFSMTMVASFVVLGGQLLMPGMAYLCRDWQVLQAVNHLPAAPHAGLYLTDWLWGSTICFARSMMDHHETHESTMFHNFYGTNYTMAGIAVASCMALCPAVGPDGWGGGGGLLMFMIITALASLLQLGLLN